MGKVITWKRKTDGAIFVEFDETRHDGSTYLYAEEKNGTGYLGDHKVTIKDLNENYEFVKEEDDEE